MLAVLVLSFSIGFVLAARHANTKWCVTRCARICGCPFSRKSGHLVVLSYAVGLLLVGIPPWLIGAFHVDVPETEMVAVACYAFCASVPLTFYIGSALILWLSNESRYRQISLK